VKLGNSFEMLCSVLHEFVLLQKDASMLSNAFAQQIEALIHQLQESSGNPIQTTE
jgi:hypothetical protein